MNKTNLGYILNIKPYKEFDALVSVYFEDESMRTFIYKSLYKPQSKRLGSSQYFVLYQFTYKDRDGLTTPTEITRIKTHQNLNEDVKKGILAQSINSLFIHLGSHLNYQLYDWAVNNLNESDNPMIVFLLILIESLNLMGLQPFVDGDVITGLLKVNHFDISKGGFVYQMIQSNYSLEQLQSIRKLFKAKPNNYSIIKDDLIDDKVINTIVEYFEYHTSFILKGFQLIKTM